MHSARAGSETQRQVSPQPTADIEYDVDSLIDSILDVDSGTHAGVDEVATQEFTLEAVESNPATSRSHISEVTRSTISESPPHRVSPAAPQAEHSAATLFSAALTQLQRVEEIRGFELSASQLGQVRNIEEARILFDLAFESIANPDTGSRYVEDVSLSVGRELSSEELAQQLAAVEAQAARRQISLKPSPADRRVRSSMEARSTHESLTADEPAPVSLPSARPSQIIIAGVIDVAVCALISLAFGLWWLDQNGMAAHELWAGARSLTKLDMLDVGSAFGVALMFMMVAYPLCISFLFRQSLGHVVANVEVLGLDGSSPGMVQRLFRALYTPLSLLCAGPFLALAGRPMLHDHLTKTRLCIRTEYPKT